MINHIWLGLIVVAVLFGAWRELFTDEKPYEEFPNVAVTDFSTQTIEWEDLETSADRSWTGPGESDIDGKSGLWSFDLSDGETASLDTPLMLESDISSPDALVFRLSGSGGGNLLSARLTDKDGELFTVGLGRIGEIEEWRKVTLAVGDLVAMPDNPAATPDAPLSLDRFVIRESAIAESQTGVLYFDAIELKLKPESNVGNKDLESKTWMGVLTASTAYWSKLSIDLAIGLIGLMMMWLGLMRIAEKAGLVQLIAKAMKPVMIRLFPDIPAESAAMGAILMNVAANMLGLGNASTPLGIKAMKEMQKLNKYKDYASNAQCMLLAINTSSVTLISATIFSYRFAAGSKDIMKFWPVMIGATVIATIVAITVCKFLEKLPVFAIPADAELNTPDSGEDEAK